MDGERKKCEDGNEIQEEVMIREKMSRKGEVEKSRGNEGRREIQRRRG